MKHHFIRLAVFVCFAFNAAHAEYDVRQIADEARVNRDPGISAAGIVVWQSLATETENKEASSEIVRYNNGTLKTLTEGTDLVAGNQLPRVFGEKVVWVANGKRSEYIAPVAAAPVDTNAPAAAPTDEIPPAGIAADPTEEPLAQSRGDNIAYWDGDDLSLLSSDGRDSAHPAMSDTLIAWQTDRKWPLGWEIMVWNNGSVSQITSNEFYDMAPQVSGNRVAWYGWDGEDYEIFLYDHDSQATTQITSNNYDDVSPVITEDLIAWQGFPSVESDIFIWQDGVITKISENIEDDSRVRAFGKQVVWQGFDGNDFEIYLYNGEKTVQLTNNRFDDTEPDIADGVVCWMGYHNNWDPEIFVLPAIDAAIEMLTDNDYEDRDPKTAGGKITWRARNEGRTMIYLAEPKQ